MNWADKDVSEKGPYNRMNREERQLRDLQRDVLCALTSGMRFEAVGDFICRRIQAMAPGVLVSVCRIADGCMCPWAAPDFPPEYGEYFSGMEIGEGVASCGTSAWRREPVMVADIATDPLWAPHRHVMIPHRFRSCWTYPVLRRDGSVGGTFAFYFRQARQPDRWLERIADASVHLCILAIELEENRMKLLQIIRFDTLTGLPNLNNLRDVISKLFVGQAPRDYGLFYIGLDRFNDINTSLGHNEGDRLLIAVANRLKEELARDEFLARGEGDSFVVLVPDCEIHTATRTGEVLLSAIRNVDVSGAVSVSLSASIGICLFNSETDKKTEVLLNARNAAIHVRGDGGGHIRFFDPDMNQVARDRLLLAAALRRAIEENRLRLEYQPQVIFPGGEIYGVEALVRWTDPVHGEVSPARFIAVAEESGDISRLSDWVMEEACRQMANWRKNGVPVPAVSVNLAPVSFRYGALPDEICALLEKYHLPGTSLVIEITEGMMVDATAETLGIMHRIRELGVGLAVDDFGTGYSSLSSLASLPVTELKIDRAFIRKLEHDQRTRSLVSAMLGVGSSLGLNVVAEGVESEAEIAFLYEHGNPVIQGWYYSPAVSAERLPDVISAIRRQGQNNSM